jgi:hypothetical protein
MAKSTKASKKVGKKASKPEAAPAEPTPVEPEPAQAAKPKTPKPLPLPLPRGWTKAARGEYMRKHYPDHK